MHFQHLNYNITILKTYTIDEQLVVKSVNKKWPNVRTVHFKSFFKLIITSLAIFSIQFSLGQARFLYKGEIL